ncbi:MAG: T9SS type A sorting domain-containing protein [Chitinophagales bacterium]
MKKLYVSVIGFLLTTLCFGQVWTGAVDNNWSNPQNWNPNGVPTARIEIPITTNKPTIFQAVPNIQSLTVKEGASFNIAINGVLQILNEHTSIGLNNNGTIQNQGSIIIEDAASFGISNNGTLVNTGSIASNNMGTHGLFNFKNFTNNGQITILNSQETGIENVGTFVNTSTVHIEGTDSIGLRNYLEFDNTGTIDILQSGAFALQNVGNFTNEGQLNIHTTLREGMTNHQTFTNHGTVTIEASNRASVVNYSNIINHAQWNIINSGLQGIMNYVSTTNYGTIEIQNSGKNGIENLNSFDNHGTIHIQKSKNVGIFNAATFINRNVLTIDESTTAGIWTQVKFENYGDMTISNTTWSGIANLGIFTNFANLEITDTFNRGIENQSTFTNEKCAVIRTDDSIVNGLNSNIINWGCIVTSFEGDNWNQSNVTNHGIIEDIYDSFGTQPVSNIGIIVSPIQICQNQTLGVAIKKGTATNLKVSSVWYKNEAHTLSAGTYNSTQNEYTNVLPFGDYWLYFDIEDLQNGCTFPIQAKLNVASNPTIEAITEDVSCFGMSDGSISITASGGSNEYQFLWGNEDLSEQALHKDLPADVYEVTVMDAQTHCSVSKSIEVSEPPIISTNFEQLQWASAPPLDKNEYSIEIVGGVVPYQYELVLEGDETAASLSELTNHQLQIEASSLSPWSLEITDANDCPYQFDLGAGGDDDINLPVIQSATILNETDLGESDGTIELTVAEGDTSCGDYTYEWSNGQYASEIDYLFAGGYTVVITDCAGNTTTAFIELERDGEKGKNRKAMKIFPNPAEDWTHLRLISENEDEVLIRLFNSSNQLIRIIYEGEISGELTYETDLDLRALPNGVYYVQLTTPSGTSIAERIMTVK